jgi:hypothetical protein
MFSYSVYEVALNEYVVVFTLPEPFKYDVAVNETIAPVNDVEPVFVHPVNTLPELPIPVMVTPRNIEFVNDDVPDTVPVIPDVVESAPAPTVIAHAVPASYPDKPKTLVNHI